MAVQKGNPAMANILHPAVAKMITDSYEIRKLQHIIDGGVANNPYPIPAGDDDSEFNDSEQSNNNTIGTHGAGDFWEWTGTTPGSYSINSSPSHLSARCASGTTSTLRGNITECGEEDLIYYAMVLSGVFIDNTDWYCELTALDTSSGNYVTIRIDYNNYSAGHLYYRSYKYISSSGTWTVSREQGESPLCWPIMLWLNRYSSGGNASCYFGVSRPGNYALRSHEYIDSEALGITDADFQPDEIRLGFYNGASGSCTFQVDSFRSW